MNYFHHFWNQICNAGVGTGIAEELQKKIRITNQIGVMTFLNLTVLAFILFLLKIPELPLILQITAIGCALLPLLNSWQQIHLTRYAYILVNDVVIAVFFLVFKGE